MITIKNFTISFDATKLDVEVEEADVNETITSALVWTEETFKDYSKAVDVSGYLQGVDNTETFTIPASDLGLEILNGIYFIEFNSSSTPDPNECYNCYNDLGVAASLFSLKECLLEKVREYSACGGFLGKGCGEDAIVPIINIDMLIRALQYSLEYGYYREAIEHYNAIQILCDDCNCNPLRTPNFKSGLDYGTLDDSLILI